MTSATPGWAFQNRLLDHYPQTGARRAYLGLVVLITVALYYALYVGGGVTPLYMAELHMSFMYLVTSLAIGNLLGAFASLLAGLSDRFGRSRLVVWGLLIVGLLTAFATPCGARQIPVRRCWASRSASSRASSWSPPPPSRAISRRRSAAPPPWACGPWARCSEA